MHSSLSFFLHFLFFFFFFRFYHLKNEKEEEEELGRLYSVALLVSEIQSCEHYAVVDYHSMQEINSSGDAFCIYAETLKSAGLK